jgi:hypothetical protein
MVPSRPEFLSSFSMASIATLPLRHGGLLLALIAALAAVHNAHAATFPNCPSTGSIRIDIKSPDTYV